MHRRLNKYFFRFALFDLDVVFWLNVKMEGLTKSVRASSEISPSVIRAASPGRYISAKKGLPDILRDFEIGPSKFLRDGRKP